jgi:2,5-diketo-D-gluconate reductase B
MNICYQKTYQRAFGTFPLKGEVLAEAIAAAAEVGYRAYDTAQMYGNEADTGAALKATGLKRGDLCITTKVHPDNFGEAKFIDSVEKSLKELQVEKVDLLLVHWPPVGGDIAPSLRLLEQALGRGLTDNIGVSNYTVKMMQDAVRIIDAPIVTNQVEFHPLLDQSVLMRGAEEVGIPLSSYSSVARGEVFKHPVFAEIGKGYGKSAAQVVLRWILQKGVSLNTMSTNPVNIRANFEIMDFTLSHIDMARIDAMTKTGYRIVSKGLVPWAPVWD